MERKFITFLIFPGVHGKLHKVQLPFYALHLVAALAIVGVITLGALANSYARMLLKVSNYDNVRNEREALKTQYRSLESVVTQTNAKLNSLQSLATEVAVTYGIGGSRRFRSVHSISNLAFSNLAGTGDSPETTYNASLYAFNLMKNMAMSGQSASLTHGPVLHGDLGLSGPAVPTLWPVRGQVTAGFGQRMDPFNGEDAFHGGLDISAPSGSQVEATADGIVISAERDSGYGNSIVVDHGYGVTTRYGHLSRIFVIVGQEVKRGQIIGAVGSTGRSTGPHLHYEVRIHDAPVNPARYLRG